MAGPDVHKYQVPCCAQDGFLASRRLLFQSAGMCLDEPNRSWRGRSHHARLGGREA